MACCKRGRTGTEGAQRELVRRAEIRGYDRSRKNYSSTKSFHEAKLKTTRQRNLKWGLH
jgi:hypothetical protein